MLDHETVLEVTRRILKLMPDNPQILQFQTAWDLLDVPGFDISDLQPSLAQTTKALVDAQRQYEEEHYGI